jgi:predicted metalloprotease with PDZ domain
MGQNEPLGLAWRGETDVKTCFAKWIVQTRGTWGAGLAALLVMVGAAMPARAEIRYSVSLADRATHKFQVTMTVPDVRGRLVVAMPAWNATYQIRDFAERVEDVRATRAGNEARLPIRDVDQQTWGISGSGTIQISYRIYWNEPGPFSSQLNTHHAFLNFAEILFYVPDRRKETTEVQFTHVPEHWRIALELPAGRCRDCFDAGGYDALADAPAEIGTFVEFRLTAGKAHLRVAMDAMNEAEWSKAAVEQWLRKIVEYETGMMREAPFQEYLFIYHVGSGAGGGGMEHANGTAIGVRDASQLPAVTAHEFFHLWNVKRIRPQTLEPVDYEHQMWTRALWFAEGVTSTYGAFTMVRSGLWSPEQYASHLAQQITQLQSRPAREWQSVEVASLDTWLDKYPFYRRPDRSISYYNKGELDGILLDILIRDATNNHKSLDDVMRYMNDTFAHRHRFYNDSADIEAAVEHVAGRSFADFFHRYVAGTDEIPWNQMLGRAGLTVKTEAVQVADPGFQWQFAFSGGAPEVSEVEPGGAAERAGLREGDRILAVDGAALPRYEGLWVSQHQPGDTVVLRVARGARQITLPLTFGAAQQTLYQVEPAPNPSRKQRHIWNGLLHGTTN